MRVHITNLYGQSSASTAQKVQNEVAEIATKTLRYNQLGIYYYNVDNDSPEMLSARLDGIIASVSFGDIVIFQFPTWNGIRFDASLVGRLSTYRGLKKVFFLHDVPPLMFEPNRDILGQYIALYNLADMLILPSQGMADFLRAEGLAVEKIVVQRMWDFPVAIDRSGGPSTSQGIRKCGNSHSRKIGAMARWSLPSRRRQGNGPAERMCVSWDGSTMTPFWRMPSGGRAALGWYGPTIPIAANT